MKMKSKTPLKIETVPGNDYPDISAVQSALLQPLARLLASTTRQALENGTMIIVDKEIKFNTENMV